MNANVPSASSASSASSSSSSSGRDRGCGQLGMLRIQRMRGLFSTYTRSTQIEPLKLVCLSTSCSINNKGRETDKRSEFQNSLLTFDCVNADVGSPTWQFVRYLPPACHECHVVPSEIHALPLFT